MKEQQKKIVIASMPEGMPVYDGSPDAVKLINERFRRRDNNGDLLETTEKMFWRVAYQVATAEKNYGASEEGILNYAVKFYKLMAERKFFPNAPTIYNAGTGNGLQYSACFVLPIGDSMEEIYEAFKRQAIIHKSGGGTGFAFSSLREKDAIVGSTRGRSSGPIPFLRVSNASTKSVIQGGTRRGANMAILSVHHPDIMEFIRCKGILDDENQEIMKKMRRHLFTKEAVKEMEAALLQEQISKFNISVAATDVFMKAVIEDAEYDLISPKNQTVVGRKKAREVMNAILEMAWKTGDPGLWFIDKTNRSPSNPLQGILYIEATNPCGEQPLFPNDVCNLGSINLHRFLSEKPDGSFDINWEKLAYAVRLSVRFLDDVIEVNPYPLPEIMKLAHQIRRIGLGVMGFADVLIHMNIPYDSIEARALGGRIMKFINDVGHNESEKLANERGPFPLWDKSIYKNGKPIRNCTITTIAPTGEISILAGCSGGIEPNYSLVGKHTSGNRELIRISPSFTRLIKIAKERGFYSEELEKKIMEIGVVGGLTEIPPDIRKIFVTAHEIHPMRHIDIQSAFQEYTDNGVSKTINLPNSATLSDIGAAYQYAFETNCLGITVFRDGCKGGVLSAGIGEKETEKSKGFRKSRPKEVMGKTIRVQTQHGGAFITINFDEEKGPSEPLEVFVSIGKSRSDVMADAETIARDLSLILRMPSPISALERLKEIRDQHEGIGGSGFAGFGKDQVISLGDAIAKAIDHYLEHYGLTGETNTEKILNILLGNFCPECQKGTLIYEEGCRGGRCTNCGYSVC
ncbi:MAG: Ribonucleoside-diphosphate reductase [Candidatus Azambacteria bacterium GW2011_GWA2_42_9]|uniref:Vitamin B12-dependent ribonucleotide reductase n=4 Tax=Candidatus Azamiibacteriota TaxID=1752741 RepID=A0A0G1BI76_9BACT|nr:MAG: Ribonucleoside-diphosphate reductase [Candidatus Azambacteria bacterium GW2011_GWB1_42_17]KKS46016.1 MAG: Ribonucleoside-diphosphate reductase [Candidatus Azambacteria bacterium GW2011_GWA1_42_19]KKS76150.1 MAG: Ribonucleoside-diphosphate reductase [Candidatus Azambacteria bacterium GW2011_GWA2_42_9]KKS88219.1 MAG: Ribonucleoside-diphosphate reductase [Parcubacteria group bacterium GW2011_GWC1_43_11]